MLQRIDYRTALGDDRYTVADGQQAVTDSTTSEAVTDDPPEVVSSFCRLCA